MRPVRLLACLLVCVGAGILAGPGPVEPGGGAAAPAKREGRDYAPYPQADAGYVTDVAKLLTQEQQERIETWLWQVESRTKVEIIVVTIPSLADYPGAANGSIESFATGLFNAYGIGNRPRNDGVLLLISSGNRRARIELGEHYGHARDKDVDRIMQRTILPRFRKGDSAGGIEAGVRAIIRELAGCRIGFPWVLVVVPAACLVLILMAVSLFRSGKRGWGWVCVGGIVLLILILIQAVGGILRHMPKGSSGGWSSGGLGGFGGGSSGGGGASGGW